MQPHHLDSFTPFQVKNLFNNAFPGSNDRYGALKDRFKRAKKWGCPLS
jgi:hypothetical protein